MHSMQVRRVQLQLACEGQSHERPKRKQRGANAPLWIFSFGRAFGQDTNILCHDTNILVKILTFASPKKIASPTKTRGRPWTVMQFGWTHERGTFVFASTLPCYTNYGQNWLHPAPVLLFLSYRRRYCTFLKYSEYPMKKFCSTTIEFQM